MRKEIPYKCDLRRQIVYYMRNRFRTKKSIVRRCTLRYKSYNETFSVWFHVCRFDPFSAGRNAQQQQQQVRRYDLYVHTERTNTPVMYMNQSFRMIITSAILSSSFYYLFRLPQKTLQYAVCKTTQKVADNLNGNMQYTPQMRSVVVEAHAIDGVLMAIPVIGLRECLISFDMRRSSDKTEQVMDFNKQHSQ